MSLDEFRLQRDAAPLALLGRRRPSPAASFALTKDGRFVLVLSSRPGDPPPPVSGLKELGRRASYCGGIAPDLCEGDRALVRPLPRAISRTCVHFARFKIHKHMP